MKMWKILVLVLWSGLAQAKLSGQQSVKCIDGDKLAKSAYQDLQAAYEMRLLTTKDFLKVIENPVTCPQLRKDLKKLHASAISSMPQSKPAIRLDRGMSAPPSFEESAVPGFRGSTPPPLPPPDEDFDEDFDDF